MKKSYVISASLGTGCYRHIRVPEGTSLYKLHQLILKAFDFDDDHAHAFFMDNRVWSPADAYYSMKMDGDERLTKRYTLKMLKLAPGDKFKYLFDYGDCWTFQCKVLRLLEEPTDIPGVIRSVGESPAQYGSEEEEEEEEPITEEEFQKLLDVLSVDRDTLFDALAYMDAAARFYGLICVEELYKIYNSQNPPLSEETFLDLIGVIGCGDNTFDFIRFSEAEDEEDLGQIYLAADYLLGEDGEQSLMELKQVQGEKPCKVLPKEELLAYSDPSYYPPTPQRIAMIRFLRRKKQALTIPPEDFCTAMQDVTALGGRPSEVLEVAEEYGLELQNEKELDEFIPLFQELYNNTPMHFNRGHTPQEMFEKTRNLEQLPGQQSLFDQPAPKTARNAPCPCGSGRKYKNCCGKNKQ